MYEVIMTRWPLANKFVLMRADLNVPLHNGTVLNAWRLEAIIPTINYLLEQQASIVLIGHLGRPKLPIHELSTIHLFPFFQQKNYSLEFAQTIAQVHTLQKKITKPTIILLENLRFLPQEKVGDTILAQQLAPLGSYFVQEAFGTLHDKDTSIILVPQEFEEDARSIGFLVAKEVAELDNFIELPTKKKVLILGGSKAKDKIPYLKKLSQIIPNILLTPPLACTFLAAEKKEMGKSLVEPSLYQMCNEFLSYAKQNGIKVHLPTDFLIEQNGNMTYAYADQVPKNAKIISIGEQTQETFCNIIASMDAGIFNGPSGFIERPETLGGTIAVLKALSTLPSLRIIAGGDSVLFAQQLHVANQITHLSTGGGATLYYIGNNTLPGLEPFKKEDKNLTNSTH